jgi:chitinase
MKNIYRQLKKFAVFLIVVIAVSCGKDSAETPLYQDARLSASADSLIFTESGGVKNLQLTTNGSVVVSVPSTINWIKYQLVGTVVSVTADALAVPLPERTADIVVTATKGTNTQQHIVRIVQRASPVNTSKVIPRDSVFVLPNSNRVVEGYLTLSPWYGYSYNDIDYASVTHIDYGFIVPKSESDPSLVYEGLQNETAALSYYPDLADKTFLGYGDKLLAEAHAANTKVLIAVAGASRLRTLLSNTVLREQFAGNLVKLLEQKGYDGIALDYEYPESNNEGYNILLLIQDLRVAFAQSTVLAPKKILITMALPVGDWAGKYYDMTALSKCVDWFSPMTYEYNSATIANINSPLYKNAGKGNTSAIDDAVYYYLNTRKVNPLQLTIGVPFYGSQYTGYTAMGAASTGALRASKDMYRDFISKGGFTEMWDNITQHSYYVNNSTNMMIVYDNERDMATKGTYLKSKGLKGAMIWELSRGFYDMGTTQNPWLKALGDAVLR